MYIDSEVSRHRSSRYLFRVRVVSLSGLTFRLCPRECVGPRYMRAASSYEASSDVAGRLSPSRVPIGDGLPSLMNMPILTVDPWWGEAARQGQGEATGFPSVSGRVGAARPRMAVPLVPSLSITAIIRRLVRPDRRSSALRIVGVSLLVITFTVERWSQVLAHLAEPYPSTAPPGSTSGPGLGRCLTRYNISWRFLMPAHCQRPDHVPPYDTNRAPP